MNDHRQCYGNLFPSNGQERNGKDRAAPVFLLLEKPWGMVRPPPDIAVDLDAWEPSYGRLAEAQVKWEAAHGRPLAGA